jgi:hypothetical protein
MAIIMLGKFQYSIRLAKKKKKVFIIHYVEKYGLDTYSEFPRESLVR